MFFDHVIEVLEIVWRFLRVNGSVKRAFKHPYGSVAIGREPCSSMAVVEVPTTPQYNPKVSIIILTLEGASLLDDLFASILHKNSWNNLEILVVNHGSDIETQNCLEAWSKRLPIQEIRLLKNYSFSFSCNRGAEIASGDILIFLNNDVVLEDDFVPRMCAAVEHDGGLVGMKLYHQKKDGTRGEHHHIGVRFRWNIRQGWTPPYNATPSQLDVDHECKPTQMPAVTAAIIGCRRNEFMDIGGFHEGYVYAYEDVDLCLKYRLGNKASVVSVNDVSALHGEGETRLKRAPSDRRIAWHHYNSAVFRQRFGPLMRRDLYEEIFDGSGASYGRRAVVGFTSDVGKSASSSLRLNLQSSFSVSKSKHAATLSGYNLFEVDLFISLNPMFDMKRCRHVHPAMISMACIMSDDPRWSEVICDHFDVLTASTQSLATSIQDRLGRPVAVLAVNEEGVERRVLELVRQFTGERHKISIKTLNDKTGKYEHLKRALQSQGHKVRIDCRGDWHCSQKLRDDVVLWEAMPEDGAVQEGSVNIALFKTSDAQSALFDGRSVLPRDEAEPEYGTLHEIIKECVARRLQVPIDTPLIDRSKMTCMDPIAGWLEKPDPVRKWLDM